MRNETILVSGYIIVTIVILYEGLLPSAATLQGAVLRGQELKWYYTGLYSQVGFSVIITH